MNSVWINVYTYLAGFHLKLTLAYKLDTKYTYNNQKEKMPAMKSQSPKKGSWSAYIQSGIFICLLKAINILPFSIRLKVVGSFVAYIIVPLAGYDKRIHDNLLLIMPDLPIQKVKKLIREVSKNVGRTFAEIYSGSDFKKRSKTALITGGGIESLNMAIKNGQGVILVSGHFGNYDVPRAVLSERGYKVGALYRPFANPFFDVYYRKIIGEISLPIIPSNERSSLTKMVRLLKSGGIIGMLVDVHKSNAPKLKFFGKLAGTATSAANLALKYNLALIPVYGIRLDDHGNYELVVEQPIVHSTPLKMTQEINDSLERQVRSHMGQYFWVHRRWKAETEYISTE